MFPPNNPHYPRNRSCTRCLNGTKRKGLYAVFTIGVFLCIIFAVTLMYEHHVLDVSKQHVLGTMHQSYNAESPKFVNEERRRESDIMPDPGAITDSPYFPKFRRLVEMHCILLDESGEATKVNQNDQESYKLYNQKLDAAVTRLLQNIFENVAGFRSDYMNKEITSTRDEWSTLKGYIIREGTSSNLRLREEAARRKVETYQAVSDEKIQKSPHFGDFKAEVEGQFILLESDGNSGTKTIGGRAYAQYETKFPEAMTNLLRFMLRDPKMWNGTHTDPGAQKLFDHKYFSPQHFSTQEIRDYLDQAITRGYEYLQKKLRTI